MVRTRPSGGGIRRGDRAERGGSDGDGPVDRRAPLETARVDAAHDVHVGREQPPRGRADRAVAQWEAVDRDDRRDLVAAPAEEGLVGDVELGAVDLALDDVEVELGTDLLDQRRARDRLEDVSRYRWRYELALPDHEERRAGALRDVPLLVQEDRRVVAVGLGLQHGEPAVLVVRAAFEPDRDRVVRGAEPRAHAAGEAPVRDAAAAPRVDVEPGRGGGVHPG